MIRRPSFLFSAVQAGHTDWDESVEKLCVKFEQLAWGSLPQNLTGTFLDTHYDPAHVVMPNSCRYTEDRILFLCWLLNDLSICG